MSALELEHAAEVTKLARLLGVDETRLDFLADVSPAAIRQFRGCAGDRLFDGDGDKLKRIAAASKLVPAPVAAKAAALAFGPLLTAAIASSVEPARGIAIAGNLRVRFLALTAIELDPRRCGPVLSELPPRLAGKVAAELVAADEHITLGRFVGAISDDALRTAAAAIPDADLLRVAFLLEDRSAIDHVVDVVADRLPGILTAAGEQHLWSHALGLLDALGDRHRETMGDLAAQLDPAMLADLIAAAQDTDAWDTLLPVTRVMSNDSLRVFAANPAVHEPETVLAVTDAALAKDMWLDLLPLAGELPTQPRAVLAARIADLDADVLDGLIVSADDAAQWAAVLPLVAVMTPAQVETVLRVPSLARPEPVTRLLGALAADEGVPAPIREAIVEHARTVGIEHAAV